MGAVQVMLATRPVDFRKGVDGLAMLVREQLGADPFCGTVFAFRSKRADRLNHLFFDGIGVVLVARRLEAGAFRWPKLGSDRGGQTWAVIASLVETCKLNAVDPQGYFADVITRIVGGHRQSQLNQLLPWAYPTIPGLRAAACAIRSAEPPR